MFDVPIAMHSLLSGFSLCQKVSIYGDTTLLIANQPVIATKQHASDVRFRKFRRQLFHCSLSKILETLRPAMTKPEVARFGDGHFRRVIYGLGPYIADYEEQVLLACIVRGWCPRYVDVFISETDDLEAWG